MYNINELREKFNNKKVFVTGHTGFKGAYLLVLLKTLGAKTYGYSLKPDELSLYNILKKESEKNNEKLLEEEVFDDVRNYDSLHSFMKKVDPDFIIHMAAQPLVRESYILPRYTFDVNVMGTVNLFDSIKEMNVDKKLSILNVTTDKVYENKDIEDYKFKEDDNLMGDDPYANSKSCSELVTHSYKYSFFNNKKNITISTARAGNVIGGGDFSKDRIVPDIYRAIKNNTKLEIRNPYSTRPYQFVLEPLFIYLNILSYQNEDKKYEGCYNVGPDAEDVLKTGDLAERVLKYMHTNTEVYKNEKKEDKDLLMHEKNFLCLDNTLIKKTFNYKKLYDNEKMIKCTADIYDLILKGEDILGSLKDLCNSIS